MLKQMKNVIQKVKKQLKRQDFLMAYLVPFLSFVIFVVAVFLLWFHYGVRAQINQNIVQNAQIKTDNAATNLNHLITGITAQARKLGGNLKLKPAYFMADHFEAYDELSDLYYRALNYDNMALLYRDTDWILTTSGTCTRNTYFPFPDSQRLINDILSQKDRIILNYRDYGANADTLIYCQALPISAYQPRYYCIFTLSYPTIVDLMHLDELYASDYTPIMALYDRNGHCIWNNSRNWDEIEFDITSYAQSGKEQAKIKLGKEEYLATRASISNEFLTIVSLEQTIVQYNSVLNTALYIMLLCILAIILFAGYTLHRGYLRCYKPVKQAVSNYRDSLAYSEEKSELEVLSYFSSQNYDEYSAQSGPLGISKGHLQSLFVLSTIRGQFSNEDELRQLQENLDIHFPHAYYFVCSLLFDAPLSQIDQQKLTALLQAQDHASMIGYYSIMPDTQTLVGIINTPDPSIVAQQDYLHHIQLLSPIFSAATLAVGNCYSTLPEMGKSYFESCAAMDYRLVKGRYTHLFYSELSRNNPESEEYPTQLIQSYLRVLRSWDVQKISNHLQEIQLYITEHQISLQMGKCICYELMNGFLGEVRTLESGHMNRLDSVCNVFSIVEFDSMNELIAKIHMLSQRICEYINQMQSSQNKEFLQQCMEYMENNINNPQFSLESLADLFGISSQTLRSRFKLLTGKTMIDVMKKMRLDLACHLLASTEMDIGQIIENVGYLDASSFSRLFKKETGMTPSEYRMARSTPTA